jgi:hypothetical protein
MLHRVAYVQFRDHASNASTIYGSYDNTSEHLIYLPLILHKGSHTDDGKEKFILPNGGII